MNIIEIVPHDPRWHQQFTDIGTNIRSTLGALALSIHHIGSTAVKGLAAKPVIDVQVTAAMFDPEIANRLAHANFIKLEHITCDHRPAGMADLPEAELDKWFFKKSMPEVNLHVRIAGNYNQRFALLCRDYLRDNAPAAQAYELIKINLARHFPNDMHAYYEIKDPVFDLLMTGAEAWAVQMGWQIPPSDV